MEVAANTLDMTREDWLELRRGGIGGSDAGTIAGLNPWRSPMELYLDKTGEIPPQPENEAMYWGTVLEDVVANEFTRRTSLKVRRRNAILRSVEHPFMLANVDRLIVGIDEGLECKTANAFTKDKWDKGGMPEMYEAQIQHYMAVTGYKAWWIAVLIGGNDFRYQRVERDDEFIKILIDLEKDFWENHILAGVMPDVDGSPASCELIKQMFPNAEPKTRINLSEEAASDLDSYLQYMEMEKKYKEAKEEYANRLKLAVGDNEVGVIGDNLINWKQVTSNRFDGKAFQKDHPDLFEKYSKASSYRRFTIKQAS